MMLVAFQSLLFKLRLELSRKDISSVSFQKISFTTYFGLRRVFCSCGVLLVSITLSKMWLKFITSIVVSDRSLLAIIFFIYFRETMILNSPIQLTLFLHIQKKIVQIAYLLCFFNNLLLIVNQ